MSRAVIGRRPPRKPSKPRVLDERTSALVIAEYLAIEGVEPGELDEIVEVDHTLSPREVALTFRMAELFEIRNPFEMAPRFRLAFARARLLMKALKAAGEPAIEIEGAA